MSKVKLFTHTDLDGVGCYIISKKYYDKVSVEYCDHDNINEKVKEYIDKKEYLEFNRCFITDISVNEEVADYIEKEFSSKMDLVHHFQLLDHHPTALNLNKYSWCEVKIIDDKTGLKTSGTEMFYKFLTEEGLGGKSTKQLDIFSELVRNYDTWRWAELGEDGVICKQVNDLLYLYGRNRFILWCLVKFHDEDFPNLYESDKMVLKVKQREIDEYIKEKNEKMIKMPYKNYNIGVVFADKYISEMGNKLCQMNTDIDFVAIIDMNKSISYRTIKEEVNLSEIAKELGGGGHPKASGSPIFTEVVQELLKMIFK